MACPACGCKVTYEIFAGDFREDNDYEMNSCTACKAIFYAMDEEPEEDEWYPVEDIL